jgi:hypothetical protein
MPFPAELLDLAGLNETAVKKNLISLQTDNPRYAINLTFVFGVFVGVSRRRNRQKKDAKRNLELSDSPTRTDRWASRSGIVRDSGCRPL